MTDRAGTVVIGDGVIGGFIVRSLLARGLPGREITWLGNRAGWLGRSSTRLSGGVIRCALPVGVAADLAAESYRETWAGHPDFIRTGSLTVVRGERPDQVSSRVGHLGDAGLVAECRPLHEFLGAGRSTDDALSVFEPNGGYASPRAVRTRLVRSADRQGVPLLDDSPVIGVHDDPATGFVEVRTENRTLIGSFVVVAAGAATARLAVPVRAHPRLREIGYGFFEGLLPRGVPAVDDADRGLWWRPAPTPRHPRRYLIGAAVDAVSDGRSCAVHSRRQERRIRSALRTVYDGADEGRYIGGVRSFDVGSGPLVESPWTLSPSGRVLAVSGLDGGGFKLAPAIGSRIAAVVHGRRT